MNLKDIIKLLTLLTTLAPAAVALILKLMEDMSGKGDDEILAEADAIFARVKAKVDAARRSG